VCVKEREKKNIILSQKKNTRIKNEYNRNEKEEEKEKKERKDPSSRYQYFPMINVLFVPEFQSKLLSTTSLHSASPPSATGVVTLMSALPAPFRTSPPGAGEECK